MAKFLVIRYTVYASADGTERQNTKKIPPNRINQPKAIYNRTFFKQRSIDYNIIRKETYIELIHSIRSLPKIQKKRIYQYYFKNKTETEIAQAEGISQKNVSVVLTKARINLYKILKKFE